MDRVKWITWGNPIETVEWWGGTVRFRYDLDYLNRWPAILTEFLEDWNWVIWSYQYRESIHSDEFWSSAGSFNISSIHTISSWNENVFTKNNSSDNIFFPVWQHYWTNTATQRVYWTDVFEETGTLDDDGTPVLCQWVQAPLQTNSSVWKASVWLTDAHTNWIKIQVWNWNSAVWKAHWVTRYEQATVENWLTEVMYDRPNETMAWNNSFFRVVDLKTWVVANCRPITELATAPYVNDTYRTFQDVQIAIKQDNWAYEFMKASEDGWDSIHTAADNEIITWTDGEYIQWD